MRRRQEGRGTEGQRDRETRRRGDGATGRDFRPVAPSPRRLVGQSLCLVLFSLFLPLIANAQTGMITGRVVNEEGAGMPGVTVYLFPVAADRRPATGLSQNQTATDEDGNFKFTELAQRV